VWDDRPSLYIHFPHPITPTATFQDGSYLLSVQMHVAPGDFNIDSDLLFIY